MYDSTVLSVFVSVCLLTLSGSATIICMSGRDTPWRMITMATVNIILITMV